MKLKIRLVYLLSVVLVVSVFWPAHAQSSSGKNIAPIITMLLLDDTDPGDRVAPGMPMLVGATSAAADQLTVEWIPAADDFTPADKMKYEIHLSITDGFEPGAGTRKTTVTGKTYATLTGLTAQTRYCVMLVAVDRGGNRSWSNQLSATTSAAAAVHTDDEVHIQEADHAPQVTETTVTYSPRDTTVPEVGEFISSVEGDGYLRKAAHVSRQDGRIVVQTEPASLAEIYEDLEFSTQIRMVDPLPTTASGAAPGTGLKPGAGPEARVMTWPTGLTFSRKGVQATRLRLSAPGAADTRHLLSAASGSSAETVVDKGDYIDLEVPIYNGASPGENIRIPLIFTPFRQIKICEERNILGKCTQWIHVDAKVCDARVTDVDHPDSDKESLNPKPSVIGNGILWEPLEGHVDEKLRPYEVEVTAWIGADMEDGCDETREKLKVDGIMIYVEQGEFDFNTEKKASAFASAGLDLTNEVTVDFEPELDIGARIQSARLKDAHIIARGNLTMIQVMEAVATATATVSGEATVFEGSFIKVIPTTIPILVRGELELKLKASATASAELDLTEKFQNTFSVEFGVEYDRSSGWRPVKGMKNNYSISIGGEARCGLSARLDLIPDVKLHFYEAISGHLILDPYLYADAGIEGHFLYLNADGGHMSDLDYFITQFEAGAGVDLDLFAGLHVFDKTIIGYPLDGEYGDPSTYKHFTPVDKTRFLGIPDLSARADDTTWSDLDSRSVLISGEAAEIENPLYSLWGFGKQYFIEFDQWTGAKLVETASTCRAGFFPGNNPGEYWLVPLTPGNCTVRLGGYSTLGWFARQTVEIGFDADDGDGDGMSDYWEARFTVHDPNGDDDFDGNSNLVEF